ncbi:MAG: phosphoenolpyruvate--protein phosphotransferase, partial [Acetatifactor sp.]|nr:phosphoenolpyruvate--protein phosphotransferase [Acetatifactor sp.]
MKTYSGKSVYSGIAIGRIHVYKKNESMVRREKIDDPDAEMERYERAKAEAIAQLKGLYD